MATVFEVGQVDWFDDIKGFGFIKQTSREDVFVHTSNAKAGVLKAGAWVVFERTAGKKGPSASKVRKLGDDPALVEGLFSSLTPLAVDAVCMVQNEGLTKKLLSWQAANLKVGGEETRFEQAEAIQKLTSKYLPAFAEELSESILPFLLPFEQWYWWQAHCPPSAITDAVTEYFESVASIHYADPKNTFNWLQVDDGSVGCVFMHRLSAAHFHVLFRALLPRQRVVESLVSDGGELLKTRWDEADDGVGWFVEKNYRLTSKRGFMLRYFAELAVDGVAELLWQYRRVVVPEVLFIQEKWILLESEDFWELLHHDLPEINELALSGYVGKMGAVTTQRVYQDVVALLRLCAASTDTGLQAEATRQVEAVVSGPVKIKLWLEGILPGLDVAAVLEQCPTLQLENYLLEAVPPLRGPAARVLLNRAAGTGGTTGIRAGLKVLFAAKQQVENVEFEQLLFVYPDASDVWLAIRQWTGEQGFQPDFSVICHWLLMQDEQADGEPLAILDLLADKEQVRFFCYIMEADPLRLMKLSTGLLLKWFERLPAEDKLASIKLIVQSRRKELALELWLTDLTDYYSFADYYLHVAMLAPEAQFLFLRKTFGLIAAGKVALTVDELDAIPRHSLEDENPLNRRLDYSFDLVLKVLKALKGGGAYPTGTELIALIIDYAKGVPAQLLQFKTLFEPCLGRSVIKLDRSIEVEVAHIGTKTYEGSSDRKSVLAGGTWYQVVNGYMTFDGKRYHVKWETQEVRPWHLEKRKVDATCCEGNKAPANDLRTEAPFWWCYGQACHCANQSDHEPESWQKFVLRDFIRIAGLRFSEEPYYRLLGLINRVNTLVKKLYCNECDIMMHPYETSDYNYYRDTKFCCVNEGCQRRGKIVYLNRCLNPRCSGVIDSRVSARCNYDALEHEGWNGMYICDNCGGCCSHHGLAKKVGDLEHIYGAGVQGHQQYRSLKRQLDLKLFHADRHQCFCYKCLSLMRAKPDQYGKGDYVCPGCGVEYRYDVAYLTTYSKSKIYNKYHPVEEEGQEIF